MCDNVNYGPKDFAGCFHFGPKDIANMKRIARNFMHGFMGSHLPYNVEDLGDSYIISIPLAGRTKEEVKVSLLNKHINIKAEKPKITERQNLKKKPDDEKSADDWCGPFFRRGFSFIEVNMDIPLPTDADTESLVSKMANGLLKIIMQKKPAKNIDINEN